MKTTFVFAENNVNQNCEKNCTVHIQKNIIDNRVVSRTMT